MSVRVRVFYPALQRLLGDTNEAAAEGSTVGECLDYLVRRHPGADKLLFDARGRLLRQVYVFVNAESTAKAEYSRPVTEKDHLIIAALALGG
jgi:hypothetical protein